jgi:hypothetical protein
MLPGEEHVKELSATTFVDSKDMSPLLWKDTPSMVSVCPAEEMLRAPWFKTVPLVVENMFWWVKEDKNIIKELRNDMKIFFVTQVALQRLNFAK